MNERKKQETARYLVQGPLSSPSHQPTNSPWPYPMPAKEYVYLCICIYIHICNSTHVYTLRDLLVYNMKKKETIKTPEQKREY
jgi:hypothetical protein